MSRFKKGWKQSEDAFFCSQNQNVVMCRTTGRSERRCGEDLLLRRVKKLVFVCLSLMVLLGVSLGISSSRADADALYTYTVTISAGGHGTFASTNGISVDNAKSGSSYQMTSDGRTVRITGLLTGDVVSCNAPAAVQLEDNSKYYVKGIRLSGRDNNTVSASAFEVTRDLNYVVAYGIPGELTEYTIYYVDEDGGELAPSQTYFGNVGDEPVIAYLYIDGYVPATYNESRALVSDPAQNAFVFVYMRGTQPDDGSGSTTIVYVDESPAPTPSAAASAAPAATTDPNASATEEVIVTEIPGETVIEYADGEEPEEGGGDETGDGSGEDGSNVTDDEDKTILDRIADAVVPLANFVKDKVAQMKEDGTLVPAIIILIALIALIILLIIFLKRKKKDEDEEQPDGQDAADGAASEAEKSSEADGADAAEPKE